MRAAQPPRSGLGRHNRPQPLIVARANPARMRRVGGKIFLCCGRYRLKLLSPSPGRTKHANRRPIAPTAKEREFWHKIERRWMHLARTEEFAERTAIMLEENRRKALN